MVYFTKHAEEKFKVLERHGLGITREKVVETVESPELVDIVSREPLCIAQGTLDDTHVLRVVYDQQDEDRVVITFYPGRRKKYGTDR